MHEINFYNTLLRLSRNIFFYKDIKLKDNFETRVYLMFFHFSLILIIFKEKGKKFDQKIYDNLFYNIEYNLREHGLGDVSVNKKMKELNKILYDILLKIIIDLGQKKEINHKLINKYFNEFKSQESNNYKQFEAYFLGFYNFCFNLPLDNMLKQAIKFNFNYGSS